MDFQSLFTETKGQPIIYQGKELKMMDKTMMTTSKLKLKVTFLSTDSIWKQGIILKTKGEFEVSGQNFPNRIVLWEDTAPKETSILVKSKDKSLIIYNAWQTENGTVHYWHNGGAMHIVESGNVKLFNCNDGYADDDLNDLVFSVEYLS